MALDFAFSRLPLNLHRRVRSTAETRPPRPECTERDFFRDELIEHRRPLAIPLFSAIFSGRLQEFFQSDVRHG